MSYDQSRGIMTVACLMLWLWSLVVGVAATPVVGVVATLVAGVVATLVVGGDGLCGRWCTTETTLSLCFAVSALGQLYAGDRR